MKKIIKTIFINIIVFFIILFIIEIFSFSILKLYNKKPDSFFLKTNLKAKKFLSDPCQKMMTHPFLNHVHDHNNKCDVKGGTVSGEFVFYFDDKIDFKRNKFLVTLGGSTTDGLYNHISNGETWPFHLSNILRYNNQKIKVINGGTGGYSSTQELLKLISKVNNLDLNIKYIISLNGINDIEGYRTNPLILDHFPYFTTDILEMFNQDRWKIYNKTKIDLMPNSILLLYYINKKILKLDYLNNLYDINSISLKKEKKIATISKYDYNNLSNADIWLSNVRFMHSFSKMNGWKYYVFLQPTMGLKGVQSEAPENTNDRLLLDKTEKSKIYIDKINGLYDKLKLHCSELSFCFDISDIAPPIGDHYNDKRHHNSKGNKVIANEIFNILKKNELQN